MGEAMTKSDPNPDQIRFDEQLAERILRGDQAALTQLIDDYIGPQLQHYFNRKPT